MKFVECAAEPGRPRICPFPFPLTIPGFRREAIVWEDSTKKTHGMNGGSGSGDDDLYIWMGRESGEGGMGMLLRKSNDSLNCSTGWCSWEEEFGRVLTIEIQGLGIIQKICKFSFRSIVSHVLNKIHSTDWLSVIVSDCFNTTLFIPTCPFQLNAPYEAHSVSTH